MTITLKEHNQIIEELKKEHAQDIEYLSNQIKQMSAKIDSQNEEIEKLKRRNYEQHAKHLKDLEEQGDRFYKAIQEQRANIPGFVNGKKNLTRKQAGIMFLNCYYRAVSSPPEDKTDKQLHKEARKLFRSQYIIDGKERTDAYFLDLYKKFK